VKTLEGRRFFFATRNDLAPGLQAIERAVDLEYVLYETRNTAEFTIIDALSSHDGLGHTAGHDVNTSPIYLIFHRGEVPSPTRVSQRRGDALFSIRPKPNCLILRSGGLHTSGALLAGELQLPLSPERGAIELFTLCVRELFRGFARVKLYRVGSEALHGLRTGQRLATISLGSPREYDLKEP
jgi:hypothetical protein